MKKELKVGEIIKVKEEHQEYLKDSREKINASVQAIEILTYRLDDKRRQLWDFINEAYPETKDKSLSLSTLDNHILITQYGKNE